MHSTDLSADAEENLSLEGDDLGQLHRVVIRVNRELNRVRLASVVARENGRPRAAIALEGVLESASDVLREVINDPDKVENLTVEYTPPPSTRWTRTVAVEYTPPPSPGRPVAEGLDSP